MNIIFTGRGTSGSWKIRGEQLGAAFGASVVPNADKKAIADAEMVYVVKKCPASVLNDLRQQHKRWVFDVLDFYPQPQCTSWSKDFAVNWVQQQIKSLDPFAVVWPNKQMMDDCSDGRPAFVLYHHFRPSLVRRATSPNFQKIAYEGSIRYLGHWQPFIESECKKRGWQFLVNPASISDCDAVVALRAPEYAGYAQVNWKSNVKLANAQGAGVPFIGQRECAYLETCSGAEMFIETESQLREALDSVSSKFVRGFMSARQFEKRYSIETAASDLRGFLHGL